jgi:hypothetical protein
MRNLLVVLVKYNRWPMIIRLLSSPAASSGNMIAAINTAMCDCDGVEASPLVTVAAFTHHPEVLHLLFDMGVSFVSRSVVSGSCRGFP